MNNIKGSASTWIMAMVCQFIFIAANGQDTTYTKNIMLGDAKISLHTSCFNNCQIPVSFINLHDDEDTSIEAAEAFLTENGGRLIQLKHITERTIVFKLEGRDYTIDPNRIFTPAGVRSTLKVFGRYTPAADKAVTAFARQLIRSFVTGKKLLVGLHNNSDSLFSIYSYTRREWKGRDALKVYINENMDADDFVYTNQPKIFNLLKKKEINVVLQNNKTVRDDGSLSVYAKLHKIPYINVEAQIGHLDEQLRMLEALKDAIYSYAK